MLLFGLDHIDSIIKLFALKYILDTTNTVAVHIASYKPCMRWWQYISQVTNHVCDDGSTYRKLQTMYALMVVYPLNDHLYESEISEFHSYPRDKRSLVVEPLMYQLQTGWIEPYLLDQKTSMPAKTTGSVNKYQSNSQYTILYINKVVCHHMCWKNIGLIHNMQHSVAQVKNETHNVDETQIRLNDITFWHLLTDNESTRLY